MSNNSVSMSNATSARSNNAARRNANAAKQPQQRPQKDSEEVRDCKTRVRLAASHVDCQNADCPLKKRCAVFDGVPLVGSADWPLDGSMAWDQIKANYMGSEDPKKKAAFRQGLNCIRETLYDEYPDYKMCSTEPLRVSSRYEEPPKAGRRASANAAKTNATKTNAAKTNAAKTNAAKPNAGKATEDSKGGLLGMFSLGKSSSGKKKTPVNNAKG